MELFALCGNLRLAEKQMARSQEIAGGTLTQGRVGHAETGANVFGEEFDGSTIGNRVSLRQIFHGLDQHLLPINVAGIGGALPLLARKIGRDRDGKHFRHENSTFSVAFLAWPFLAFLYLECFWTLPLQYIAATVVFQLVFCGSEI